MTMFQSTVKNAECKGTARRSIELVTTIRIKKVRTKEKLLRGQRLRNNHNHGYIHFKKGKARILSSGKVVGDPGVWNVVNDRNPSKNKAASSSTLPMVENRFKALGESFHNHAV